MTPQINVHVSISTLSSAAMWHPMAQRANKHCRPATASNAPTVTEAQTSPLSPFWREFRQQVGRLEGLRPVPVPSDLQLHTDTAMNITVRAGAFHSDRLRYGRFLFLTTRDHEVLLGALHPTVYSAMHPSMVFEIASLGPNSWMVSFDFPPLGGGGTPVSPSLAKLFSKLESIRAEASQLAVPIRIPLDTDSPLSSLCVISSAQAPLQRKKKGRSQKTVANISSTAPGTNSASPHADLSLQSIPLRAFKSALSTYLNSLVTAPLDNSLASVVGVTAAHAAQAEQVGGAIDFLGCDALEAAFGSAWVERLRSLVLDDEYGLPSDEDLEAMMMRESDLGARSEFIYFDPGRLTMDS